MKILTVLLSCLLASSLCYGQRLKHRNEQDHGERADKCIDIRLFPEKGKLHYEYLTGDYPARGDLKWELGELFLKHPYNCRVNVFVDEALPLLDLKIVPRMALDAGFQDLHVYVLWSHTGAYLLSKKDLMAEVSLIPSEERGAEIVYGKIERFPKTRVPKDGSAELKERDIFPSDNNR